jgi:O-antigen/teichoic acid export membrane protein
MTTLEASAASRAAAPISGWRRLFGDTLLVGGATLVCHALGAVTSLLLRALLDPAQMGVWQGLKVFLGYANYTNLGVSKAATRELNIALGRGDDAPAQRSLNLAFTANTIGAALYAVGLAACAGWRIVAHGRVAWADGWTSGLLVVAALALLQRHVTFQVTILRCRQAFRAASQLSVQEAVLTLCCSAVATWLWGLPGLFAATVVVMLASLWYLRRQETADFHWAWNWREVWRLAVIGGPILLAGVVASLFASLDKLMILAYLPDGDYQLGCYSAALLVTAQLYGLGNMLAVTSGPRFGELFGRTGSRRETARLAVRLTELQAAALAPIAGLAIVAGPPVLAAILPQYRSGLPALAWLVPGTFCAALALPLGQCIVAVEGGRKVLIALALGLVVASVGNHLALEHGLGLIGVAAATSAANVVYFVALASLVAGRDLAAGEGRRFGGGLLLACGPCLGVALLLNSLTTDFHTDWTALAGAIVVVLLAWGAALGCGWRWGGWSDELQRTVKSCASCATTSNKDVS